MRPRYARVMPPAMPVISCTVVGCAISPKTDTLAPALVPISISTYAASPLVGPNVQFKRVPNNSPAAVKLINPAGVPARPVIVLLAASVYFDTWPIAPTALTLAV